VWTRNSNSTGISRYDFDANLIGTYPAQNLGTMMTYVTTPEPSLIAFAPLLICGRGGRKKRT
jgi:hypothetical protein